MFCCLLLIGLHALCQDFTNKGKEFWTAYGHNNLFSSNTQTMVLYLSADAAANVTVSINGTSWSKTYSIPAHSVVVSDPMPKTGTDDCRILDEGLSSRGIHIQSDTPIVAYVHTYGTYSSGATMLLPVETYSYTYFSVNPEQSGSDSYSWFYVVASEDNTRIKITPSRPTIYQQQNTAFTVSLNKGQVYNVMGKVVGSSSYDVSGSRVQSVEGIDGKCHPVGVFSGSSRTYVCAGSDPFNSGSDYMMQQVFPLNAWGTKYITALTSKSTSPSELNNNKYRIYVRESNTLVRKNGILQTGLVNNFYYDIPATSADVITATKPVLVAQFIPSANGCGTTGLGDPEMFLLSPIDQAINNITFYNTNKESINVNYLTMVIPTNGIPSLKIDGLSSNFDHSYPHPNAPGYTVVIKQLPLAPMQHTATSDSSFTAITYGLGQFESYGYNAGTFLKNLESSVVVKNGNSTSYGNYTCPGTPFQAVLKTTYKPSSILWKLSAVPNLSPNTDVLLTNYPAPTDSVTEFQRKFYLYALPSNYTFSAPGSFTIPVKVTDLLIENCSFAESLNIPISVVPGPVVDFGIASSSCAKDSIHFNGTSPESAIIKRWNWDFGDASIDSVQNPIKAYTVAATYTIKLQAIRNDGCLGNTSKTVEIYPLPIANFQLPNAVCMPNGAAAFTNLSSSANTIVSYDWNFGDNSTASTKDPIHNYSSASNYPVMLKTTTDKQCKDSITKTISSFFNSPVANFMNTGTLTCQDEPIFFQDKSTSSTSLISWNWSLGNGHSSTLQNPPSQLYSNTGNIPVELIAKDVNGCADTLQRTITINPKPIVDAGADKVLVKGASYPLNGMVSNLVPLSVSWFPTNGLSNPNSLLTIASPTTTQRYTLTTTSSEGCSAKDSVLIKILENLVVPNAFSPNGDGINDTWIIEGIGSYTSAVVEVFNRGGQKVFESRGYGTPWNGMSNGKALPVGTYYYIINPNSQYADRLSGYISIVR